MGVLVSRPEVEAVILSRAGGGGALVFGGVGLFGGGFLFGCVFLFGGILLFVHAGAVCLLKSRGHAGNEEERAAGGEPTQVVPVLPAASVAEAV